MDYAKLKLKDAKIQNHSVRFEYFKLDNSGKLTLERHIHTIGPNQDISELPEYETAICEAARIGYTEPTE